MEIGCRYVDGIPTQEMWKFSVIGTLVEVAKNLFRQTAGGEPHQNKWDGNNYLP